MPTELTDEDVFGAKEMSDEDVFGGELSDDEVFGNVRTPSAKALAARPEIEKQIEYRSDPSPKWQENLLGAIGSLTPAFEHFGRNLVNSPGTIANLAAGKEIIAPFNGLDLSGALETPLKVVESGIQSTYPGFTLTQENAPAAGVARTAESLAGQLTDPDLAVMLPAYSTGIPEALAVPATVARGVMAGEALKQIPAVHAETSRVFSDPNATTAQKAEAASGMLAADTIAAGMTSQVLPKTPALPGFPEGAELAAIRGGRGVTPPSQRQLGVRIPEGEFAQPGVAQLADAALREAQGGVAIPGRQSALDALRNEINPPRVDLVDPTRVAERVQGGGEAPYGKISYRRGAEDISRAADERQNYPEPKPTDVLGELQTVERPGTPLRSTEDIIRDRLMKRDFVAAVDELSKQPIEAQRKTVDAILDVGRNKVPLTAAERTIFNEIWDKVYQESLGRSGETQSPKPYFDRASEAEGLGRPSTAPTIEDIRAARAAESRGQNAIQQEGDPVLRPVQEPPRESPQQMPSEVAGGKADVGGGKENAAAKEVSNLEQKFDSGDIADLGKIKHSTGIEYGLTLPKEDLPRIQAKYDEAGKKWIEASAKNDNAEAMKQGYRHTFYGGALMGITEGKHPISGSNYELFKQNKAKEPTVESVTALDPASGSPKSSIAPLIEKMDARLAQVQEQIRKGFYKGQTAMGVPAAILDTALQAARLALKAGKPIAEAVEAAIKHIKFNVQKFNEAEVRKMFEKELGTAPVRADVGVSAKTVPSVATKTPTQTLEGIKKIFEPTKKEGPSLKQKGINIIEAFRTGISSKFRPVNKLAEDIAKAYGMNNPRDIAGIMEQLKGSQGKAEADIYRFDRDVSKLVKGDEADFNSYVFLRRSLDRLEQDAKDINRAIAGEDVKALNRRAVAQYTINELTPALDLLKQKLGPEKLSNFEKAADAYQTHMDQALRLQVESGRMAPEVYDAIKAGNQFYAPFKVMKYIEDTMRPEGTGRRIDTVADYTKAMKGIEDPNFKLGDMLSSARQGIAMSRILADKNNAMRAFAELAAFDSNGTFIRKLKPTEDAPKGMGVVNVLEGGEKTRYAVEQGVADAIQMSGGNAGGVLLKMLSYGAVPFRAGATALNLPFQVSNWMADTPRQALVSKYGIRGLNDLWKYPAQFVESAYSSMMGDVLGKKNQLMLDFLDSGVAGTTIQEHLTPSGLRFQESSRLSKGKKLASSVLHLIPDFAQAIEQTNKILGVKRAMEFHGVTSGKELAAKIPEAITEIRRFSGSPDFGRQGKTIEAAKLNLLYMFLNARIQGTIADVGRLSGRDGAKTAARTWRNLAFAVGLPTALLYWLNNNKENKDDFAKIPEREKQNYWHIPKDSYITTDEGEKIRDYWRIPKRESSKWIANLTESAINFAEKHDPKAAKDFGSSMIQELSPVNIQGDTAQERIESVASGTHPFIKAAFELGSGRDLYRNRSIVPDSMKEASPEQQYKKSTSEAYKKLAEIMPDVAPEFLRSPLVIENLTKNMTAGLITQFLPRKPIEGRNAIENQPLLSRFQAAPYTDNSQFKEEMDVLKRDAADEQLARHRAATKLIDDNKGKELEQILDKAPEDEKLIRHIVDLWIAKENGITFQERQLLALPVNQRAAYVANQLKGLDPVEQQNKIEELARKRILTESVFEQLPEQMK